MVPTDLAEFVFQNDLVQKIFRMHSSRFIQSSVLRAMYDGDRRFCDVMLYGVPPSGKTTDDLQPIRAQKNVLAFASKHLFELFTSDDYIDSNQAEYHIENVDHDTLGRIVELIYTDQLITSAEDAVDIVCRVLTGAKYLIIPNLADACETYLAGDAQIKPENCVRLWCFARKYSCLELMHATSSYIANNLAIMPADAEFLRISYNDCAKLLLSENMITADSDQRCLAAIRWLNHDETGRAMFVSDIINMIPLTFGEVSANTIHEAYGCEMLKTHASDTVYKLVAGVLEKLKSAPPTVSASLVGFDQDDGSCNRNWYVIGGTETPRLFLRYDVSHQLWTRLPDLPWERDLLGACAVGNQLVAVGGRRKGSTSNLIDAYDVTTETWRKCAKMHVPRRRLAVCSDSERLFALGGLDGCNDDYCSAEKYSSKSTKTVKIADMGWKRSSFAAASKNNFIFAAGGWNDNCSVVEKYDMCSNVWCRICQLNENRCELAGVVAGDDLYLVGGRRWPGDIPVVLAEIVNIRTGQIRKAPNLLQARAGCGATTLNCGRIVCVIGGYGRDNIAMSGVETFDMREGKWSTGTIVPDMPTAAYEFGFAVL